MEWLNRDNPFANAPNSSAGLPSVLPWNEATDMIEGCPGASAFLGVSGPSEPVTVDLESESPHVLVNMPTGVGKSSVARSLAVQRLSRGDVCVILDRKMHSHRWARGLAPLTHYADDVPSIAQALFNMGNELQRRNMIVRDFPGPASQAPIGPRVIVLFEELNATLTALRELDRQMGVTGSGAFAAFQDVMFMGRAVKMHMVGFAQLASYRSGLSQDILENFGTRVLGQYSDKAWKWLASDCGRYQVAPPEAGRAVVCSRGRAVRTQLTFLPEESAQGLVLGSVAAQRRARELSGGRSRHLPPVWRTAIG